MLTLLMWVEDCEWPAQDLLTKVRSFMLSLDMLSGNIVHHMIIFLVSLEELFDLLWHIASSQK